MFHLESFEFFFFQSYWDSFSLSALFCFPSQECGIKDSAKKNGKNSNTCFGICRKLLSTLRCGVAV